MNQSQLRDLKTNDLVVTSSTFGLMRKVLIEHLGQQKAKRFLLRFGKDLGIEKAKEMLSGPDDLETLIDEIQSIHAGLGHVSGLRRKGALEYRDNRLHFKDLGGVWYDSFEVKMQLESFGLSDECSCYILSGFASGMMTMLCGEEIFVKEVTCCARGDAQCAFEVQTREHWEALHGEILPIYDERTFVDELEGTYDQLLEKTRLLDKVSDFHNRITESIAQQKDLPHLLKITADLLETGAFITDTEGNILFREGVDEPLPDLEAVFSSHAFDSLGTGKHEIENGCMMTSPILLNERVEGYCCLLYDAPSAVPLNDHLFLERLAVAASLCFLNEKVSFETTERLKINFLDRMVHSRFENKTELALHASYLNPKILPPFRMISIKPLHACQPDVLTDHYHILISIAKSLKLYNLNGLLTQKGDNILMFLYGYKDEAHTFKVFESIMEKLSKDLPPFRFKAGVSKAFTDLEQLSGSVTEAEQAANFPKDSMLVHYEDLGILGSLLENINPGVIEGIATRELKSLLEPSDKNRELLHTLYVFLKNNQKLEKTMKDLALSIGGIQYRIGKIEKMLDKDLKDSTTTAHLLLMIETLILTGTLSFE
ncbi:V4R domain-containing protein [Salinicoccus halitifaciens]|uniref:Sugar diacid utilization regulator/predicted hydrocarbon binding protein n=1 Tax=Salinicoccus halitifaciens TaxID=1073415 RepID=A0ABV2EBV0_9STAP|nr:V4R domain-containing protein [Salinicoccus halitifaciens]MCD2137552.1 helix-turn-helix domain-containing protein [Salinicoccus halitifaciens]